MSLLFILLVWLDEWRLFYYAMFTGPKTRYNFQQNSTPMSQKHSHSLHITITIHNFKPFSSVFCFQDYSDPAPSKSCKDEFKVAFGVSG